MAQPHIGHVGSSANGHCACWPARRIRAKFPAALFRRRGLRGWASQPDRGFLLSIGFVLGQTTVDTGIGVLFGLIGLTMIVTIARYLAVTNLAIAAILAVLGLALLRKIHIVLPVLRPTARRVETFAAAYALGIPFGLTTCLACTPLVLPVLGGLLLFAFGIARGAPPLVVGAAAQAVKRVPRFTLWVPVIERVGGVLLLIAAAFFLYQSAAFTGVVPTLQSTFGINFGS